MSGAVGPAAELITYQTAQSDSINEGTKYQVKHAGVPNTRYKERKPSMRYDDEAFKKRESTLTDLQNAASSSDRATNMNNQPNSLKMKKLVEEINRNS